MMSIMKLKVTSCVNFSEKLMIFIVMDDGNGLPARIEISENMGGKLLSHLEWPNVRCISHLYLFSNWF